MILNLSDNAGSVMLDALGNTMDGGTIEILDVHQRVLATLRLSTPAAAAAVDGTLELNKIFEEDAAPVSGTATFARILRRNGDEVFSCDVGPLETDCVIRLNTTAIHQGGPVRIDSFKLTMPQ